MVRAEAGAILLPMVTALRLCGNEWYSQLESSAVHEVPHSMSARGCTIDRRRSLWSPDGRRQASYDIRFLRCLSLPQIHSDG